MIAPTPTDIATLARTIWGEARGEPFLGKLAVGWVVVNRAGRPGWWGGPDLRSVCLKPWQFSCWNQNDPNRARMLTLAIGAPLQSAERNGLEDSVFRDCYAAAVLAAGGHLPDPTSGATHYFAAQLARQGRPPAWAEGRHPVASIGGHLFFKEV